MPAGRHLSRPGMCSLRFYLSGVSTVVNTLYELLCNNCITVTARDPDQGPTGPVISLSPSLLRPVGLHDDEDVIPYTRRSFAGYRLLQEYFTFPDKFFFIEVNGLERLAEAGFGARTDLNFTISRFERSERHQMLEQGVSAKTLRLGCTPIINLFSQAAEPITVDHTKFEYPVMPDVRRQTTTEIFSIDEVTAQNPK